MLPPQSAPKLNSTTMEMMWPTCCSSYSHALPPPPPHYSFSSWSHASEAIAPIHYDANCFGMFPGVGGSGHDELWSTDAYPPPPAYNNTMWSSSGPYGACSDHLVTPPQSAPQTLDHSSSAAASYGLDTCTYSTMLQSNYAMEMDCLNSSCQSHSHLSTTPSSSMNLSNSCAAGNLPSSDLSQSTLASNVRSSLSFCLADANSKPPFSYITLIVSAIGSFPSRMATLNDIYHWIMQRFPYYRKNTRRWQNSVRHALSFNDCFLKVARPSGEPGKGSYWIIHPDAMNMLNSGTSMRRSRKFIDLYKKEMESTKKSKCH